VNYDSAPNLIAAGAANWCGSIKERNSCDNEPWATRRDEATLFAPGVGVFSTTHRFDAAGHAQEPYRTNFGGTSAATPLIAGVAALVTKANQNWSAARVIEQIRTNARRVDGARRLVDLCNALHGEAKCK
jgi:subtilisin family serine protease